MSNKRIIICDDDEGILDMLTLVLEDSGYQVIAEANSLNLYQLIETEQPDLLLVDLWMPVLSGDQVVRRLKANVDTKNLPVIVISASTDGHKIAAEAGADSYIAKPFDIDELVDTVQSYLEKRMAS